MQKATDNRETKRSQSMSEVMTVNGDQFRGLMTSGTPFVLLDFRESKSKPMLNRARHMSSDEALNHIESNKMDHSQPIVLICGDGTESMRIAEKLDELGFINVVVLEGGNATISTDVML